MMAGVLLLLLRADVLRLQHLKLYLIAYGGYRFLTEFIRPEPQLALGLTFYQWVSLFLIAGLAVQWQFDRLSEPERQRGEVIPACQSPSASEGR